MSKEENRRWMEDNLLRPLGERMIELGIVEEEDTRTWTIKWEDYNNE